MPIPWIPLITAGASLLGNLSRSRGGSGSNVTTQTNQLDPQVMGMFQDNYNRARSVADLPFQPYPAESRVAPRSTMQLKAANFADAAFDNRTGAGLLGDAASFARQAAGYNPLVVTPQSYNPASMGAAPQLASPRPYTPASMGAAPRMGSLSMTSASVGPAAQAQAAQLGRGSVRDVRAQSFTDRDINPYLNNGLNQLVDTTLSGFDRNADATRTQQLANATAARAFGGSRHGVLEAATESELARARAGAEAGLRYDAFDKAAGLMGQDLDRDFAGQQANQGMDFGVGSLNTQNQQQSNLYNATAENNRRLAQADYDQQANVQNLMSGLQTGQFNSGMDADWRRAEAGRQDTAGMFNAEQSLQAGQFNTGLEADWRQAEAGRQDAAGRFNAEQSLAGQGMNQSAGLQGAELGLRGAGLLGELSNQELGQEMARIGLLSEHGALAQAEDQAVRNAQFDEFNRWQDHPYRAQGLLNTSLGMMPQPMNTTTRAPGPDRFGQVLDAGASLLASYLGRRD